MPGNELRFRAWVDDQVSKPLDRINDGFTRLGGPNAPASFWGNVGAGMVRKGFDMVADGASAATDFIMESVDAASDLNESASKSRVVFGDSADEIEAFGDTSAKSLGISKQAAIEANATFGNFFTGLGKGQHEAAGMSKQMVTLASDLASFNNMDPTETLDKLRAGLAGEAEPLRRMGVFLSEAKVKAKAMELGLADANGEISEGAKVTARYHLILDETKTAQGDFARTADEQANSQRRLNAELADGQAALGEKLLPAQRDVTHAQLELFTTLGAIGDLMAGKTTPETLALGASIFKAEEATLAADLAALRARDALNFMAIAAKDDSVAIRGALTPALIRAADASEEFAKDTRTAQERSRDLVTGLLEDANALIDGYYEPIEMRQDMQANKAEITAARRILASSDASAAEKRDARATITQAQHDNDRLALELLSTGKMSTKEQKALVASLQERLKEATGAEKRYIRDLIAEVKRLDGLTAYINIVNRIRTVGVGASVHAGGFAEGGLIPAGASGFVGEEGIERATALPGGGVVITPMSGGFGGFGGGGGGEFHIHFHSLTTPSPAEGQRLARAMIPELKRELGRLGFN